MSAGNTQYNLIRAYSMNELSVAAAVTLKVGRDSDLFMINNPINVNAASTYDIIVPDGIQANQEIFFFVSARTGQSVVTVNDTALTLDAVGEWAILRWTDSTTGWVKVAGATGT